MSERARGGLPSCLASVVDHWGGWYVEGVCGGGWDAEGVCMGELIHVRDRSYERTLVPTGKKSLL